MLFALGTFSQHVVIEGVPFPSGCYNSTLCDVYIQDDALVQDTFLLHRTKENDNHVSRPKICLHNNRYIRCFWCLYRWLRHCHVLWSRCRLWQRHNLKSWCRIGWSRNSGVCRPSVWLYVSYVPSLYRTENTQHTYIYIYIYVRRTLTNIALDDVIVAVDVGKNRSDAKELQAYDRYVRDYVDRIKCSVNVISAQAQVKKYTG